MEFLALSVAGSRRFNRRAHVKQPAIALERADQVRSMPRPESWVAALFQVCGWPAPVLHEKQGEPPSSRRKVVFVRVHRPQEVIGLDALVEALYETLKEVETANALIDGQLGHAGDSRRASLCRGAGHAPKEAIRAALPTMAGVTPPLPDLVLYGRPGCHLCEDTLDVLRALLAEREGLGRPIPPLVERDIETDEDWLRGYLLTIPVVAYGEQELSLATSPAKLRRFLAEVLDGE